MSNQHYHSEESIGFMTITAHRMLQSTFRRRLKEADVDLTPDQWGVLVMLWGRESATQDELAAGQCVDKSAMSRTLSAMRDKGLISKATDPTNERKKNISTTDASRKLCERVFTMASETMRLALKGISEEEAAICMQVLAAIKQNLAEKHA